MSVDEARAIGIAPINIIPEPDDSDFTSPGAGYEYVPDLSKLAPALRRKVEKMLSDFDPSTASD